MKLESRFRVTYSMLLNLLRVEHLRIEDMLQRSYVESASLRHALTRKATLTKVCQFFLKTFLRYPPFEVIVGIVEVSKSLLLAVC